MDPTKKISFGFSKSNKKPISINKPEQKQVELIDCLEGHSIKLKNEIKVVEKGPLIIPLRDNKKDLLDRVRDMKVKQKQNLENKDIEDNRPDSELTENELAVREVIRDAKQRLSEKEISNSKVMVLPMIADELPLEGENEPTLEDYENVPVSDFGLAILRGMGWKEGSGIGKNPNKAASLNAPELRPKGLGLGASVLANSQTSKESSSKDNPELILKKGCFAKILAGNQKGNYCEVQGFDDEAGRVVVKTTVKKEILTLSEFMVVPVSSTEYERNSKIINNAKFEEYKEKEQQKIKTEDTEYTYKAENENIQKGNGNERPDSNYEQASRSVKLEKRDTYSSDESDKGKYNKQDRGRSYSRRRSDISSNSDSDFDDSRKTHKRKDKRRHRDKSRSPYKSKHKSSKKSSKSKHRHSSSDSDSGREHKYKNHSKSESDRHRRRNKR